MDSRTKEVMREALLREINAELGGMNLQEIRGIRAIPRREPVKAGEATFVMIFFDNDKDFPVTVRWNKQGVVNIEFNTSVSYAYRSYVYPSLYFLFNGLHGMQLLEEWSTATMACATEALPRQDEIMIDMGGNWNLWFPLFGSLANFINRHQAQELSA